MSVDQQLIGLAQQRHREQSLRIIDAAAGDAVTAAAVLVALADQLSGEAAAITNAKRKGHVSAAREWTQAAVLTRGMATRLLRVVPPTVEPVTVADDEEKDGGGDVLDAAGLLDAPVIVGLCPECIDVANNEDPTPWCECQNFEQCDSLVGSTACRQRAHVPDACPRRPVTLAVDISADRETSTVATMDAAGVVEIVNPFTDPPSIETLTAMMMVESPFTSPAPAVERLTWAAFADRSAALAPAPESSYSQVNALSDCAMKYQLTRLSRHGQAAPERPGWALVGGNAVHSAIAEIERMALAGKSTMALDAESLWAQHFESQIESVRVTTVSEPRTWHASTRGREGYDWWRVEGAAMVRRWITLQTDDRRSRTCIAMFSGAPAIELEYRLPVVDGIVSHGYIDSAWLDRMDSSLAIVDYKTGASGAPSDTIQMGEYGWALVDAFGVPARNITAAYWLARTGEFSTPFNPLTRHPRAEIEYRHRSANALKATGAFLPNLSSRFCGASCGMADQCPARGSA